MGDWIILLSSREPHHACHSMTPFSRRQRGAGCIIRRYFAFGFHVAPSWSRGIGVRAQPHMGSSQFALRLHFLCSAIWQAGRGPAAFSPPGNPYGGSHTQAHFHSACTWWLLFFSRASCFSFLPSPFHVKVEQDVPAQQACSPLLMSSYFLFQFHTVKAGCFVKQTSWAKVRANRMCSHLGGGT